MSGGFDTHPVELHQGVKFRIDDQVQIPDQQSVSIDNFIKATAHPHKSRDAHPSSNEADFPGSVRLGSHDGDNLPEIDKGGIGKSDSRAKENTPLRNTLERISPGEVSHLESLSLGKAPYALSPDFDP